MARVQRMLEGFLDKSAAANGKGKTTAEGVETRATLRDTFGRRKEDSKDNGNSKKRQKDEDEATRSLRNSEWGRYMQKPGGK